MNIPLFHVGMAPEASAAVARVLQSGYVGEGPVVAQFESALHAVLQSDGRPLATVSCTAALEMALHLAGVRPGTEVITTPQTCTATTGAIVRLGARVVWADIDPVTGLIDPADVARKVWQRTAAIVAVDWAGRVCDYPALAACGPPVIADAAHGFLAARAGVPVAQAGAAYVCWSFGPIKALTCGGHGGALLVPLAQRDRARLYRWHGLDRESQADFRCQQDITEPGIKAHLTDGDAAIGLANLVRAHQDVAAARARARRYVEAFTDQPRLTIAPFDPGCSYWLFTLLAEDRDDLSGYLARHGIASGRVHARNDRHTAYRFPSGPLPGVDAFDRRQLSIPVGGWLTDEDEAHVVAAVLAWASGRQP